MSTLRGKGPFGISYAVLFGGFPFRRPGGAVAGTMMGTAYGLALGTGFLLSPVPKAVGAGVFGADFGAKFAITVYLAHAGFGALLGWLVHRYGTRITPLWSVACELLPSHRARTGGI
ncbi:hypothetical protein [Streptomyces sp. AVP053U2]|uniref:hypothetical protein n=2 Tax=unclassified Streptomyces TaxID=2593676 RepID=UPI00159EFF11|nr:hypothetical protein [Streptomyces sp. AVP053U2]